MLRRYFLVSPTLFMTATVVEVEESEPGVHKTVQPNPLIGSYSSSLHRLKDIDNKGQILRGFSRYARPSDPYYPDGGFFVFGDISCRKEGVFRLQFSLFELQLYDPQRVQGMQEPALTPSSPNSDPSGVNFIKCVFSEPFKVVPQKEFKGLMESTHLSRAFSDQGVRLRLRKEARTLAGYVGQEPDILSLFNG